MVRMGSVWDSTAQVFAGRGAAITRVTMMTLFLPSVLQAALALARGETSRSLLDSLIGLAVAVITLLGSLAIVALASDPAVDERGGYRIAGETLLGGIAANLLLGLALCLLVVPGVLLLARAGFDFQAAMVDGPQPRLDAGAALWAVLYLLVWSVFVLWAIVRLAPLHAVIVNERRGASAIRRAFVLTRGLALRLFGVIILFLIVLAVVWSATTSVTGLAFRLALGPDQTMATGFVVALIDAAVTAGATALSAVFCARLYAAIRAEREAPARP
jgi:hypothetical protein